LNEQALDEAAGIGGPAGRLVVFCGAGGAARIALTSGPVDWNTNGVINGALVAQNVKFIQGLSNATDMANNQVLLGHDDWDNLVYNFRNSADFANGPSFVGDDDDEADDDQTSPDEYLDGGLGSPDFDGDGIPNSLDDDPG